MYVHSRAGFIEVDRLQKGAKIPDEMHMFCIRNLRIKVGDSPIYIVRSREERTIRTLQEWSGLDCEVFNTPQWDYPWRCYLTQHQLFSVMEEIVLHTDYKNFKESCKEQHDLALAIWKEAWEAALPDGTYTECDICGQRKLTKNCPLCQGGLSS